MNKEANEQVVEAEFTEVEPKKAETKCAIVVGMTVDGDIFFDVQGSDQNLLLMEGLLKYAERHMDRVWVERLDTASKA